MKTYSIEKEYQINEDFKKYVDEYAKVRNIEPEETLTHALVYVTGQAEIGNKAIDDFTAKLIKHISNVPSKRIGGGNVFIVAEELKGGAV